MKIKFKITLIAFVAVLAFTVLSCEDDTAVETVTVTEIVTETVTETVIETVTDTVFVDQEVNNITRFILVRHAERETTGNDPGLTTEGMERAENLAEILSQIDLDRVYSTNFNRTLETAMPTAMNQELSITNYGGFDHEEVIDDILENQNEGAVLIVGHSNTTPNFLNSLTGTTDYMDIQEDEFDNLFIVSTRSKGDSDVVHLKY